MIILVNSAEIENARYALPCEIVVVASVIESIGVIFSVEGIIQREPDVFGIRLLIDVVQIRA